MQGMGGMGPGRFRVRVLFNLGYNLARRSECAVDAYQKTRE